MPHSLSARKRIRQNERRRERNRAVKSRLRSARRAVLKALETRDVPAARDRLRRFTQLAQRAAARGPLHRNTAARLIGRLQKHLTAVEQGGAAAKA